MPRGVQVNSPAPDFAQEDYKGLTVSLKDYRGKKNVLLVLNRGFF